MMVVIVDYENMSVKLVIFVYSTSAMISNESIKPRMKLHKWNTTHFRICQQLS